MRDPDPTGYHGGGAIRGMHEWHGEWHEAERHADRAHDFFQRGRWAEAEAELRKALAVDPDRGEWQFNLGLTLEAAGRDEEALGCFRRTTELLPEGVDAYVAAGACCNRLGRHEDALPLLESACRLDPTCEGAYAQRILALAELDRHDEAETVFFLGQQRMDEMPHSLAAIGESLLTRGLHERAGWCFREAARLEPSLPRVRARLAAVMSATGHPQKAVQLYLQELREAPGDVETLLDFGNLLVELNRAPEAAEKFSRAVELEPANPMAHWALGDLAMRTGTPDRAILEFELVHRLDPDFPCIHLELADAHLKAGDLPAARTRLRAHLGTPEADASSEEQAARLGDMLTECGLFQEAACVLEAALRTFPQEPLLWRQLAFARFRSGDRTGGVQASRTHLELEPDSVEAAYNLALAAVEDRRLEEAREILAAALRRHPQDQGLRHLRTRRLLLVALERSSRASRRVITSASSLGSRAGRGAASLLRRLPGVARRSR